MDESEKVIEIPWIVGNLLIVDGRNVQRSMWPNVSDQRLCSAIRRWLDSSEYDWALVIFDGEIGTGPIRESGEVIMIGTGCASADDVIVDLALQRAEATDELLIDVVTSDRGLRARLGSGVRFPWGGGGYLRILGLR